MYVPTQASALVAPFSHFSSRAILLREFSCIGFHTRFCFSCDDHGYMLDVFHYCFSLYFCRPACTLCSWMLHLIRIWGGHLRTWIWGLVALVRTLVSISRCVDSLNSFGSDLCLFIHLRGREATNLRGGPALYISREYI